MEINNEELEKDLTEQYALLVEEEQEEKKKKRYFILFICFLFMFLMMFGTTFSYIKIYNNKEQQDEEVLLKELYIEGFEESFKFDSNVYKYVISVPSNTKILNVKYVLGCQKCSVDIKGNDNLTPGSNEIEIIVKDEHGNEIKYIIYVIVEEEIENENNSNLNIKTLSVSNHSLNEKFDENKMSYIVSGIKNNEQSIEIKYELIDSSNKVVIKLNDELVTRIPTKEGNINKLPLNVSTELTMGTNKVELIIKDDKGNEKIYYLYLIVEQYEDTDQIVKEITVEYGNNNGIYNIDNIVPGWESSEKQYIKITNKSNYDIKLDIDWVDVTNTFVNTDDLEYTLFVENRERKTSRFPYLDENIIKELEIKANSTIYCYVNYKYIYRDDDQNIDQGKYFKGTLKVSLSN